MFGYFSAISGTQAIFPLPFLTNETEKVNLFTFR